MASFFRFNPFTHKLDLIGEVNTPAGPLNTLSSEGGAPVNPSANNFNFSGAVAGGATTNGAILFNASAIGEMDAKVQVDNVTIKINASNKLEVIAPLSWVTQSVDLTAVPGTGYFANSGSIRPGGGLQLALPSPTVVGASFAVYDFNGNGWFINESGTQKIIISGDTTTPGTGSLHSIFTGGGDTVTLVCQDATVGAEVWIATAYDGNVGVL